MEQKEKDLLTDIYVAHVLILAAQIREQKKARGVHGTSDYVREAVQEITQQRQRVLEYRRTAA